MGVTGVTVAVFVVVATMLRVEIAILITTIHVAARCIRAPPCVHLFVRIATRSLSRPEASLSISRCSSFCLPSSSISSALEHAVRVARAAPERIVHS